MDENKGSLDMNGIIETYIIPWGVRIVGALLFFIVLWMIAGWIQSMVTKALNKSKMDRTLSVFFSGAVKWLVLLLGALGALSIFGVETTSFAAVIGAAGLAIGLAFQGSLSNLAAGVMLLIFRPFKVGDVITACGVTAKVTAISLFTTDVDTVDNRRFILPNSSVFGSTIENISFHATRRVDVAVGCDYGADLEETRRALTKAAESIEKGLKDPAPAVVLTGLGASSVDWSVRVWVNASDFWPVKESLTQAVKNHLDEAGIGIPFPQMDVHVDDVFVQAFHAKKEEK